MTDNLPSSNSKSNGKKNKPRRNVNFSVRERVVPCSMFCVIPFFAQFLAHTTAMPEFEEKPHDITEEELIQFMNLEWDNVSYTNWAPKIPTVVVEEIQIQVQDEIPFRETPSTPLYYETANEPLIDTPDPIWAQSIQPPPQLEAPAIYEDPGIPTMNMPPVADLEAQTLAHPGDRIEFDGSGSYDLDGEVVSYSFDFGDGNSYRESRDPFSGSIYAPDGQFDGKTSYTYQESGIYKTTLTVQDNLGLKDTVTKVIKVNTAPVFLTPGDTDTKTPGIEDPKLSPPGDPHTQDNPATTNVVEGTLDAVKNDGSANSVKNIVQLGADWTAKANAYDPDSNGSIAGYAFWIDANKDNVFSNKEFVGFSTSGEIKVSHKAFNFQEGQDYVMKSMVFDNLGDSATSFDTFHVNDKTDVLGIKVVSPSGDFLPKVTLDAVKDSADPNTLNNIVQPGSNWTADASGSLVPTGSGSGNWQATFTVSDTDDSIDGIGDSHKFWITDKNGVENLISPISTTYTSLGGGKYDVLVDFDGNSLSLNPGDAYGIKFSITDDSQATTIDTSHSFTYSLGSGGGLPTIDKYEFYIDQNQDGDYSDLGEKVSGFSTTSDYQIDAGNFALFGSLAQGQDYNMKVVATDSNNNTDFAISKFHINYLPQQLNPGDSDPKTPGVEDPQYKPGVDPNPSTSWVEGKLDAVKNIADNPGTSDNEALLTSNNYVEQGKSWTAISNAYDPDGTIASHDYYIDINKDGTYDSGEYAGTVLSTNTAELTISNAKFTNLALGSYNMEVVITDNTGAKASSVDKFTVVERPAILNPGDNPTKTPDKVDNPLYDPGTDPKHTIDNPGTPYVEGKLDAVENDGSQNTINNVVQPGADWKALANAYQPQGAIDHYDFWIKDNTNNYIFAGTSINGELNIDHTKYSLTEGQDYEMKVLVTDTLGLTATSTDTFHVNDKADILSATVSQPGNSGIPSVTLDAVKGSTDDPLTTTINEGNNVVNEGDTWTAASDGSITPTGSGSLDWTASFVVSDTDNSFDGINDSFKFTITDKNGDQLITPLTSSYTDLGGGQYKVDITFDGSGLSVDPLNNYSIKLQVTDDYSGVSSDNSKFFTTQPPSAGVPTIDKYEYWIDANNDGTYDSNEIVSGNTNEVNVNSSTFSEFGSLQQGQDYNMKVVLTDTNGNTADAISIFHVNYKPQLTNFSIQQPTTGGYLNSESLDAVTVNNPNVVNTWDNWNANAYAQIGSGGGSTNWVATFIVTDTDNAIDGNNDAFTFAITDDNNPGSFTQITSSDIVNTQYYDIGGGQYQIVVEFNMPSGTSFSGANTNSYGVEFNITDDSGGNTVDQSKTFTYDDSVGPTNAIAKYEFWIDDNKNGIYENSERVYDSNTGLDYSLDGNIKVDRTKFTFMPGQDFNMKVRITDTQGSYVETSDNFRVNAPPVIAGIAVNLDAVGTIGSGSGNADVNQIQLGDIFTPIFSAQNFLAAGNDGIGTSVVYIDLNHDGDFQWWLGEEQWFNPGDSINSLNFGSKNSSLVAGESYLMTVYVFDGGFNFVGRSIDEFSVAPVSPPASNLKVNLDSVVNSNNGGNSSTNTLAPGTNHEVPAKPSIYGGVSNVDNDGPYNAAGKFVGGYDQFGNAYNAAYDEFGSYVGGYSFDSLTNSYVNDGYGAYDSNGVFVGGFDSSGNILNSGSYDINGNKVGNYDMKFIPGITAQYGYDGDFDTTNSFDVQVNLDGSSGSISYEYWIDFDRNGFFDSYESVGSNSLSGVGNNFTFTIDSNQFSQINDFKPGEVYRMQVLIRDDSTGESQYAFDTFNIYSGDKNIDRIYPLAFQQGTDTNGDPIVSYGANVNLGDNTKLLIPIVRDIDGNGVYADYRLPVRQDLSYPNGYNFFYVADKPYSILDTQLNKLPLLPGIQYNLEFGIGDNDGAGAGLQRSPTLFVNSPPQIAGINVNLDSVTDNYALGKSDTLVDVISPNSNWTATANASSTVGQIVKYEFYIDSQDQNQLFESNELVGTSSKGDLNFGTVLIDYAAHNIQENQSYLMKVVATDDKGNTSIDYDRFYVDGSIYKVAHKFDIDAVKNSSVLGQEGTLSNQANAGNSWIVDTNFSSDNKTAVVDSYEFWIDTNQDGQFSGNETSFVFYGERFYSSAKTPAEIAVNNLYGGLTYFANGEFKIDPSTFKNTNQFTPLISGQEYNIRVQVNTSIGSLVSYDNFTYVDSKNPVIGFDAVQDNANIPATIKNIAALGEDWTLVTNATDTDGQFHTYEYWINTGDNITPNWTLIGANDQQTITLNTDNLKVLSYDAATNTYTSGDPVSLNTNTNYDMKVVVKDILPMPNSTFSVGTGSEFHSSISFVQPPNAQPDNLTIVDPVNGGTSVINVLSNDTGFTGALKVTVDNSSPYGSFTVNPDNTVTYTIFNSGGLSSTGEDSTTYTVTDSNGFVDKGTISIKALLSPGAYNDNVNIVAANGGIVEFSVLSNDISPNSEPFSVTYTSDGTYGVVTQGSAGNLVYQVTDLTGLQSKGTDTFTYNITNSSGISDTATVTVNYVNSAPVANFDIASRANLSDTTITIKALGNDIDPDGDSISIDNTYSLVSSYGNGTITLNPDQTFTYTITNKAGFDTNGDSFIYQIKDSNGLTSTNYVNLAPNTTPDPLPNNVPISTPDNATVLGGVGSSTNIKVLTNDYDPDGDQLTINSKTDGSFGSVTINLNGTITYTITDDAGFKAAGVDQISYTIDDGRGGTATEFVNISRINANLLGVNDSFTVYEDQYQILDVVKNDYAADPDKLFNVSIELISGTTKMGGQVSFSSYYYGGYIPANGAKIVYSPPPNFNNNGFNGSNAPGGTILDSFTYQLRAADGSISKPITVEVNVLPVDDIAYAVSDNVYNTVQANGSNLDIILNGKPSVTFNGSSAITNPVFAPDLSKVAFSMNNDIYTIKVDGTGLTKITNTPTVAENYIGWSPQGSKITYLSDVANDGYKDLYVIDSKGYTFGAATDLIVDYNKPLSSYSGTTNYGPATFYGGGYSSSSSATYRDAIYWSNDESTIQVNTVTSNNYAYYGTGPVQSSSSVSYGVNGYINSTTGAAITNPAVSSWYQGNRSYTYFNEPYYDSVQGYLVDSSNSSGVNIYVLNNDYPDKDGDPFAIISPASFTTSRGGTVLNDGTKLTYIGSPTYTGPDIFSYTLTGGSTATVQVWVF